MTIDKKELTKLSPEERIKKLRLMEEDRKKEVTEIERLIKESMHEIKTDKLADEIAPEQKAVDISKLFETTGEKLEKTLNAEQLSRFKGKGDYRVFARAYEDYSSLKKIMGYATMGSLSEEQIGLVDSIGARLDKTKYVPVSTELANLTVASQIVLHKIKRYMGL